MKCSLGISNFLEEMSSLPHSVIFLYFFALIAEEGFLISSLLFFGTLHSDACIFPFLLCFSPLFFSQLFVRPPQTAILLFCISFPWDKPDILECKVKWALESITMNKSSGGDKQVQGVRSDRQSAWWTMEGGSWHCTEDRNQDHPQEKEMQKSKMAIWRGLINSCEKKGSENQRRKGKIYPFECRVPKNSKER